MSLLASLDLLLSSVGSRWLIGLGLIATLLIPPPQSLALTRVTQKSKFKGVRGKDFVSITKDDFVTISSDVGQQILFDTNSDGSIDLVKIISGDVEIEKSWSSGNLFHRIILKKRRENDVIEARLYFNTVTSSYELWSAQRRPYKKLFSMDSRFNSEETWDLEDKEVKCQINSDSAQIEDLTVFGREVETALTSQVGLGGDRDCSKKTEVALALKQLYSKSSAQKKYLQCLTEISTHKSTALKINSFFPEESTLSGERSFLRCEAGMDDSKKGYFDEKKTEIVLNSDYLKKVSGSEKLPDLIFHEMLHAVELENHEKIEDIVSCCSQGYEEKRESCKKANNGEPHIDPALLHTPGIGRLLAELDNSEPGVTISALADITAGVSKAADRISKKPDCLKQMTPECRRELDLAMDTIGSAVASSCRPRLHPEVCQEITKEFARGKSSILAECTKESKNLCLLVKDRSDVNQEGVQSHLVSPSESGKQEAKKQTVAGRVKSFSEDDTLDFSYVAGQIDNPQDAKKVIAKSRSAIRRAVADAGIVLKKIDLELLPRAQAGEMRGAVMSAAKVSTTAFGKNGKPRFRMSDGRSVASVGAFPQATQPIQPKVGTPSPESGAPPKVDSSLMIADNRESEKPKSEKPTFPLPNKEGSKTNRSEPLATKVSGAVRIERPYQALSSTTPVSTPRPVRNTSDILRILKEVDQPRALLEQAWFLDGLNNHRVQIIDGQSVYGSSQPMHKWNLKWVLGGAST